VNAIPTRPAFLALAALLLVAAVFWAYVPGLDGGFVFDDLPNIVHNTELHVRSLDPDEWLTAIFSSPSSRLQRPLAMASFALNHYFTGLDPRPMKWTNICIHATNALLVLGLVLALLRAVPGEQWSERRRLWCALFVAAVWALQPINLMAVLFVVQRMESLCHLFVFAGLWLYVSGRARQLQGLPGGWARLLAGLAGGTGLGLLAKESALLLPLYAGALELFVFRFGSAQARDRLRLQLLFLFVLVLPALAALLLLLPAAFGTGAFANREFTAYERLLTELRVVLDYLHWSVLPDLDKLGLYHDDFAISRGWLSPPSTLGAALVLAAVAASAWLLRRRRPLTALGIAWFFCAQALTATIIPLELMFEHRNYFASLGIALALGDLLLLGARSTTSARLRAGAAVALLLLYATQTHLRASEWDHPVRFVSTEVAKHPRSPRATYELARMLVVLSNYRTDSPYLKPAMDAIEAARRAPGASLLPAQAALIVAARSGQPLRDEWWEDFIHRLKTQPFGPQAAAALASMVDCANEGMCRFPPGRMLEAFDAALSHGEYPELFNLYGSYALRSLGDVPLALRAWREAVRTQPSEPQYHINLAKLLIVLRRDDEAMAEIQALRAIGRIGQYESLARNLEADLRQHRAARDSGARSEPPPPAPAPSAPKPSS
jgi:hypothetical protein